MSILMFSGMRKPILSLVFLKNVYIYATLFWLIVFFPVLIMPGWFSYGDIWADVELLSLWMFFCKT